MSNPFAEGENRTIRPPSTALVIFGATGDLTSRKLIPAVYSLAQDSFLPTSFVVVGVARSKLTDEEFRAKVYDGVKQFARHPSSDEAWAKFSQNIFYQTVDNNTPADFAGLQKRLQEICKKKGEDLNYLFYLATAPDFFGPIATNLKRAGLVEESGKGFRSTSIIVEKPFGHDLNSARELNQTLRQSFSEDQIYRIDHYLGKETVQNILVFRFANGIFEPLWNRGHIDHIQIIVAENIGVGSRAGYFDQSGILRDIVQNHLLQILALLCIEPPISLSSADSIRDEKVKVLRSMRRFKVEDVYNHTVRAHYAKGFVDGKEVPGYLEEKGVGKNSQTETFVALKMFIDNWRFAGVPIFVRAGKRLPKRITEIAVYFKSAPEAMFKGRESLELEQNVLAIQVQPKEGIALKICSKPPGLRMRVKPVVMDFSYHASFGIASPDAYERLLLDAMKGDAALFTRNDEIEEAWDLLAPVFEAWNNPAPPQLSDYEAGSWGPKEAAKL